jgi:hypothetical protein
MKKAAFIKETLLANREDLNLRKKLKVLHLEARIVLVWCWNLDTGK